MWWYSAEYLSSPTPYIPSSSASLFAPNADPKLTAVEQTGIIIIAGRPKETKDAPIARDERQAVRPLLTHFNHRLLIALPCAICYYDCTYSAQSWAVWETHNPHTVQGMVSSFNHTANMAQRHRDVLNATRGLSGRPLTKNVQEADKRPTIAAKT
jgi:hypothetical protein